MTLSNIMKSLVRPFAPGAVLSYAFFLLFPHVAALTHTHAEGAHAHHHAFLSAHDLGLERAALAVAPEGTPNGELDRGESPRFPMDVTGFAVLGAARDLAHTHVQGDPNVVGIGAPKLAPSASALRPEAPALATVSLPDAAILAASARAPPRG